MQLPHVVNRNVFSCPLNFVQTFDSSTTHFVYMHSICLFYGYLFETISLLLAEIFSLLNSFIWHFYCLFISFSCQMPIIFLWSVHFDHWLSYFIKSNRVIVFINFWNTHHFRPFGSSRSNNWLYNKMHMHSLMPPMKLMLGLLHKKSRCSFILASLNFSSCPIEIVMERWLTESPTKNKRYVNKMLPLKRCY